MTSAEKRLTVGQVAARLGVKAPTVVRYARAGILPCTRTAGGLRGPGHRRFREADVQALVTKLAAGAP